jgi:hypothetical protein
MNPFPHFNLSDHPMSYKCIYYAMLICGEDEIRESEVSL